MKWPADRPRSRARRYFAWISGAFQSVGQSVTSARSWAMSSGPEGERGGDPVEFGGRLVAGEGEAFVPIGCLQALARLVQHGGGQAIGKGGAGDRAGAAVAQIFGRGDGEAQLDKVAISGGIARVDAPAGKIALVIIAEIGALQRVDAGGDGRARRAMAEIGSGLSGAGGQGFGAGGVYRAMVAQIEAAAPAPIKLAPQAGGKPRAEDMGGAVARGDAVGAEPAGEACELDQAAARRGDRARRRSRRS